jgi:hypothetical protein
VNPTLGEPGPTASRPATITDDGLLVPVQFQYRYPLNPTIKPPVRYSSARRLGGRQAFGGEVTRYLTSPRRVDRFEGSSPHGPSPGPAARAALEIGPRCHAQYTTTYGALLVLIREEATSGSGRIFRSSRPARRHPSDRTIDGSVPPKPHPQSSTVSPPASTVRNTRIDPGALERRHHHYAREKRSSVWWPRPPMRVSRGLHARKLPRPGGVAPPGPSLIERRPSRSLGRRHRRPCSGRRRAP